MDALTIGQQIKKKYPQYAQMDDVVLGQKYMKKYGTSPIPDTPQTTIPATNGATPVSQMTTNGQPPVTQTPQVNYITGRSPEEHMRALQKARAAGNKVAEADIMSNFEKETQHQKDIASGAFDTAEQKAQKKLEADKNKSVEVKNQIMSELKIKAQAVRDIIEMGKSGKLTGEQYKTALGQAASDFNKQALFAKEDKVAGSALTAVELAQLGGGIIGISSQGQSMVDRWTGKVPAPKPNIEDTEDVIAQKMEYVLTGKPPSSEQPKEAGFMGGLVNNAGKDIYDMVNGMLNIPAAVKAGIQDRIKNKQPIDGNSLLASGASTMIMGLVNEYNELLGRPLEGGDVLGRIGERAYEKPVTTALDVLPFAGTLKKLSNVGKAGKLAKVGEAVDAVNTADKGFFPAFGKKVSSLKNDIQGRAATSVGVVDKENVVRSEQMLSKALKQTDSITRRGMAKELRNSIKPANEAIDTWVSNADKTIGLQPLDEIKKSVRAKMEATTVGQANPQLIELVLSRLDKQLKAGVLKGGREHGEIYGTNLSKMNEVRKHLNSSIPDRWFESKPTMSSTDNLSHLNWAASEELKNIMSDLDDAGTIKNLLHRQYVAYEASPVLSKMALSVPESHSIWSAAYQAVKNSFNLVGEPIHISLARLMQGKGGAGISTIGVDDIKPPAVKSPIVNPIPESSATLKPMPGGTATPLEGAADIAKPPVSLKRDMRTRQGNATFKNGEEIFKKKNPQAPSSSVQKVNPPDSFSSINSGIEKQLQNQASRFNDGLSFLKNNEVEISINNIDVGKGGIKAGYTGKPSMTKGNIDVNYYPHNGKIVLTDGNHRLYEAVNRGETTIKARVTIKNEKGLPIHNSFWEKNRVNPPDTKVLSPKVTPQLNEIKQPSQIAKPVEKDIFGKPIVDEVPMIGSGEQILETKAGWKPGMRKESDTAMITKDREAVKRLLPEVPEEYKKRFATEIKNLTDAPKADPLIAEAKKYKSAEEFVKAQGDTLYHGTSANFNTTDFKGGYLTKDKSYADVYQSPSASSISYGEAGIKNKQSGKPRTLEFVLPKEAKIFDYTNPKHRKLLDDYWGKSSMSREYNPTKTGQLDWTEGENVVEYFEEKGIKFDGIKLDEAGGVDPISRLEVKRAPSVRIINPKILKTKSQLTDIWNQANGAGAKQSPLKFKGGEDAFKPAEMPKDIPDDTAQILRGTKGLTADDIMKTHPNIKLKKDVPATDIFGKKVQIPDGEKLTPYELKGNKVLLQDGETYIVTKNQFQNIKGQSIEAVGKPFAPELDTLEETVKGSRMKSVDDAIKEATKKGDTEGVEILKRLKILDREKDSSIYQQGEKNLVNGLNHARQWSRYKDGKFDINASKNLSFESVNRAREYLGGLDAMRGGKYKQYTLPGGENYREVLIKAPETLKKGEYGTDVIDKSQTFRSSHWDEPNVVSHVRLNDRTFNGQKVTFMEELQSDWAREARNKGMANESGLNSQGLPDLRTPYNPHLKNWQELSVKRALKDAVDNNSDYFAWINGEQTSARYNLATHVKDVKWNPSQIGGKTIKLSPKAGSSEIGITLDKNGSIIGSSQGDWKGKKLDEVLGKGLADKIMEKESGTLSGEGLKFGGEWASNLYDKQVKSIVEDLTGQKVEMLDMGLPINREKETFTLHTRNKQGQLISAKEVTPKEVKVGLEINKGDNNYIITDVLGDGKFKAVPKDQLDKWKNINPDTKMSGGRRLGDLSKQEQLDIQKAQLESFTHTFDISTKPTQQMGIKLTPEVRARIKGEAPKIETSGVKFKNGQSIFKK